MLRRTKARRILRERSNQLAAVTGIPATRIEEEMTSRRLTPGEWAQLHDLDPVTFEPRGNTTEEALAHAQRLWERIRLGDNAPMPDPLVMERIGALYERFAHIEFNKVPLVTEVQQQNAILVELHRCGARMDAVWLNDALHRAGYEENQFKMMKSQQEHDEWQQRAVAQEQDESDNG